MELSEFTIRLVLLFFPGIVATSLFRLLSNKGYIDNREYFINTLIFSFLSYGILTFIDSKCKTSIKCTFFKALSNSKIPINYREVLIAVVIGVVLSIISLYISNFNLIYMLGRKARITTNTGEADVWGELFNNSNRGIKDFVYIIFLDKDLIYAGTVEKFSLNSQCREIVLENVKVYKEKYRSHELRSMNRVYLQLTADDNVIIEIRTNSVEEKK